MNKQECLCNILKETAIGKANIHVFRHAFGAHHVAKVTNPKIVQDDMELDVTNIP